MEISGKVIQQKIIDDIGTRLFGKKVVFLQFGENLVSENFVKVKTKLAKKLGVTAEYVFLDTVDTIKAVEYVQQYSEGVDGVVVQLPVAKELDQITICNSIPLELDIDILGEEMWKAFCNSTTQNVPPVAAAIFEVLTRECPDYNKKNIVVVGHGKLVGEPIKILLQKNFVTPTVIDIHTHPDEKRKLLKSADVIISGVGVPSLIQGVDIQSGVVLIDAGTSEQNGALVGDFDVSCYEVASKYTPVPGGIGPITIAKLFSNIT